MALARRRTTWTRLGAKFMSPYREGSRSVVMSQAVGLVGGALQQMSRSKLLRNYLGRPYLSASFWIWSHLPASLWSSPSVRTYGAHLQNLIQLRAFRMQSTGTFFFRNRPEVELLIRLLDPIGPGARVNMTILGCSKGAEVYSFSYALRTRRPDLDPRICALDIDKNILDFAEAGVYSVEHDEGQTDQSRVSLGPGEHVADMTFRDQTAGSIFERTSPEEMEAMFEPDGEKACVRDRYRNGIDWRLGDAADPDLVQALGLQDIVVANRFLCHMRPDEAEACLRNLARLVKGGGYLFVSGVDLGVRSKVARDLAWRPVTELIEEIHEGDPSLRRGWPFEYWGLEPFDRRQDDWEIRYSSVFQLPEQPALSSS